MNERDLNDMSGGGRSVPDEARQDGQKNTEPGCEDHVRNSPGPAGEERADDGDRMDAARSLSGERISVTREDEP